MSRAQLETSYLLIGNSVASVRAIEAIRALDAEGSITVVGREPYHVYSRPLISYFLAGAVTSERMYFRDADFYSRHRVRTLLGKEAVSLDARNRLLTLADGEVIRFDKLLLATGSVPLRPPIEGLDSRGVFTFTTWADAMAIKKFLGQYEVSQAAVIGGGLIGLKATEALLHLGIKVVLIEIAERLMAANLDSKASAIITASLRESGCQVMTGTRASSLVAYPDRRARGIILEGGTLVPADIVIVAAGVAPDKNLAQQAGLAVNRGILVDNFMATSAPGIYAAGDVAEGPELISGQTSVLALWSNAARQGYTAGFNMAGERREYEGGLAMNSVEIGSLPIISVGVVQPEETGERYEVLSDYQPDKKCYRKIVLEDGRLIGALLVGSIDRAGIYTGLIRAGLNLAARKEELLKPDFGLIYLPSEYRKHLVSGLGIEV